MVYKYIWWICNFHCIRSEYEIILNSKKKIIWFVFEGHMATKMGVSVADVAKGGRRVHY